MNNQGTTTNNEITEEETRQLNTHESEHMGRLGGGQRPLVPPPPPTRTTRPRVPSPPPPPLPRTTLMASSGTTSNNIEITEDHVTVFVAYNGKWEYDRKEWFFENSKSSIMVVPKRVTLSEITDILHKQLKVNKRFCYLKLEVHYRTGSPWFPVTEIQNNQDLKVFISETSKTKLPLCVTLVYKSANVGQKRRKDPVTVFVAYDGKWEYDGKEWFFENSKSSIMVVPKHITLSEITEILHKQLKVNKEDYRLKLEVHYRTGSPWFPVTEIQNDQDLSVFISETSKTKLPLCVTLLDDDEINSDDDEINYDDDEERQKDNVMVFVAYDGEWEWDCKEWLFRKFKGSIMVVSKYVTISEITDIICTKFNVDQDSYGLKLEVYYRVGFPIIEIECDEELSLFISESSKTKLPLCVTRLAKAVVRERVGQHEINPDINKESTLGREVNTVENRLIKAIRKNDWVQAREIINTEEVTWTSKLDDDGNTALHLVVGRCYDNDVLRDIIVGINRELLITTVDNDGQTPAHDAAIFGNTDSLKIILDSNPKCLFTPNVYKTLPIHSALMVREIETFLYLFKQMKSSTVEYDEFLRDRGGFRLLDLVIDKGLIDVAYELINDYPSLATIVSGDESALEYIIRKPELFYGTHNYSFYSRFVYHIVPIENNNFCSTDAADLENQETPKMDKFATKYRRRCLHEVISRICVKLWETTLLHVPHVKHLKDDKVKHNTTIKLLRRVCEEVDKTYKESDIERLFWPTFYLAVENNNAEAIDVLTTYFKGLYKSEKNGQDIFQLTVLNRSEKVYSFIKNHKPYAKSEFSESQDDDDNNILHLAGCLAPIHKVNAASGAALQMQRELQWFEELKRVVGITHTRELNKNKETPIMVFRREHKELRKDGEEWMKKTADSYTITAALIITIVFAAAITVPGGNDSATGKPIYETKASLIIFAISDAISLFTSTTSLLLFLSILTARYADEDFLYKMPKRLIFGLVMLFVSVTSMMIAFSAALYIMFGQGKQWILIPIGALACLPIASFVTLQFPLLVELISSTYGHGYFGKEKDDRSADANKKKRA